ncbi:MAG TPA: hypothetical protein EYP33_07695, partial [Pyrodictium sp.]|nr:hypothetical protein [Pyrodictium sp.]
DRLTRGLQRPRSRGSDPAEERRERQTTMHYYTLFLRGFLEWLGLDVKVPVVRKPRSPRVEALRPEEVERLVSAARDPLDLLIVALLFETGLRAQEAVGLRLRDVDTGRREIRVRNAKYGEERVVLYGPLTEQALEIWLALNPKLGPDDPLLGISYSGLYKRLKTLARRAGLDPRRVRPHVLRHTFATEALRRGVPLPVVQRLLGHHDIKVTQIYLHLLDEDIRAAYQRAFATQPAAQTPQPLAQQQLMEIRERILSGNCKKGVGQLTSRDMGAEYVHSISEDVQLVDSMKVVLDCGDGATSSLAVRLLEKLGCEVIPLFGEPDGSRSSRPADPSDVESLVALSTG